MLAAILRDFNNLLLEDIPIPDPGLGEVLIQIQSCGFCATDFKAIRGIRRNVNFPLIPGHEPAGIVAGVGSHVTHVKEGDAVIIQPSGYCGLCQYCRMGMTHYCQQSYTTGGDSPDDVRPGSFAEYTLTGANTVYHKPASIDFDAACQTEPVSGAWKGIIHQSEMRVGDDVVIIGTGSIGVYCLSDYSLSTAKRLGATHTVNPKQVDARQAIYDIMPDGPDLVVEAAGPIEAVRLMVSLLRRGTRWNVFGITTPEEFKLDGGLMHFLEARMDASFGTNPLAMQQAIRLMQRDLVDPGLVISHRFPLSEINQALDVMASTERNKVIIHSNT
ncbi:TPA: hypothetical protein EYN98_24065 [Candidatus Poribacteria bacterium]|nr:hypothetical protein [Candidatus Poribacteria bacterium]